MNLHRDWRSMFRKGSILTLLVLACKSDSTTGPNVNPEIPPPALAAVVCTVNLESLSVSCVPQSGTAGPSLNYSLAPDSKGPSENSIFGGQHSNVNVNTSNIVNDVGLHHFSFDVNVTNLSVQPIGTADGLTTDNSLSVFFHSGPTTTGGSGIVTVFNPDGTGTFTAGGQPFFKYGEILHHLETSGTKHWVLDYAPSVTAFEFILLISASLQFPDGYVDIYPATDAVTVPGGTFQLQDTVRNGLGGVNSLQTVAWSSDNPAVATVDAFGLVRGVALGSATITATQSLKIGAKVVLVLPPTPPNAFNDSTSSHSAPGEEFHASFNTPFVSGIPGVLGNDALGAPLAQVTSYGGDSLGNLVTDHAAGTTVSPLPGHVDGSLQINANGGVLFTPPAGFTGYWVTSYRISNGVGVSDAKLRLAVGVRPSAADFTYTPNILGNVGINTSLSTHSTVGATGDGLVYMITGAAHGTPSIHPAGTFEFLPDVGYVGAASFDYNATNGFGTTDDRQVKITVAGRVWFVDGAAAGTGDGRYGSPLKCIGGPSTCLGSPAVDDIVHIRAGTYLIPDTWSLGRDARIIGEGAAGAFSSAQNANVAWPADAGAEPLTSGARPLLNSGGQYVIFTGSAVVRGLILGDASQFSMGTTGGVISFREGAIVNHIGGAAQLRTAPNMDISLDSIVATSRGLSMNDHSGSLRSAVTRIIGTVSISGTAAVDLGDGSIQAPLGFPLFVTQGGSLRFAGSITNFSQPLTIGGTGAASPCPNVTLSGPVKSATDGIVVQNCSTGAILFSGADSVSTGASDAITVKNNSAQVRFTGGALSAVTTTGRAFVATNSATVAVTGSGNSLSSAGNIALFVDSVGLEGLTFRSISANGGANGIFLKNTSGAGGLTITGNTSGNCGGQATPMVVPDVADCTGGTIQNMTGTLPAGAGIYLENTKNISLGRVRIRGNAEYGVYGSGVAGFAMGRSYVSNNGSSATGDGTGGIFLYQASGNLSVDRSFLDSGAVSNVFIKNVPGSLHFQMIGTVIGNDGPNGINGVSLISDNFSNTAVSDTISVSIASNRFLGSRGIGMSTVLHGKFTGPFSFTNNTMTNNHPTPSSFHQAFLLNMLPTDSSSFTYDISGNTINNNTAANQSGDALSASFNGNGNSVISGSITTNAIGSPGVDKSGSARGRAIAVPFFGTANYTLNIDQNLITETVSDGIRVDVQGATPASKLTATIRANSVFQPPASAVSPRGLVFTVVTGTPNVCAVIGGPLAADKNSLFVSEQSAGFNDMFVSNTSASPLKLPGYAGTLLDASAVTAYLFGRNAAPRVQVAIPGGVVGSAC